MFDVLVYLFETYIHAEACPAPEQLARRLTAAGFEEDEISDALEWLSDLNQTASEYTAFSAPSAGAMRLYSSEETAKLGREGIGFLLFLEDSGVLDGANRELILDRLMALPDSHVSVSRLKVIVLIVLWKQAYPMDSLVLDELLSEDDDISPALH
ncbi:DUF494 family protein [Denitromonas ohlonensis]|jgi:Smg protein|uniref:Protein Smg homolog n=2 Tax=Denitromonas TaxID=139331 RepID=A0A557RQG7_9RHOO|nr:DUF494 domain-containing protein [Denitromonas ohlonensis]TVT51242.1 MAG: DUF494 domain-containing protein [Denitromonas halophila]TVO67388.1 DUF494 domain-containing protein [Denitromonas ohlonensis]TVO72007.1 DUF494 domain-containing protein [Denitromonas ohlonensis]TVT72128.1 MAG: DUF494 domain-containing protein [Denitromonas halophila]TVT74332.1 MAG: DUF494 domain-containing protein [Denitromonas halophila]